MKSENGAAANYCIMADNCTQGLLYIRTYKLTSYILIELLMK